MTGRLLEEIKQRRPWKLVEEEAFLNVQRTADVLMQAVTATLKPYSLSPAQYNVLRILRGASPDGLPCGEVAVRMINRDPDITRLLDRLEKRGFVGRSREQKDRRVITARITKEGQRVLAELDRPMLATHQRLLGHLGERKSKSLIRLLEEARGRFL